MYLVSKREVFFGVIQRSENAVDFLGRQFEKKIDLLALKG
jgi:hypothetical protein